MSWVEWLGKPEPVTSDTALISLHLWPANCACPRQSWSFSLDHCSSEPDSNAPPGEAFRSLDIEISELHFSSSDWRELSGREIHATPAWQDAHEYCGEYGQIERATVQLTVFESRRREDGTMDAEHLIWIGEDFHLRLGTRDGHCFPCELEAWLLPSKEWNRSEPEMPNELALTANGPPNLRVIAPAYFSEARLEMPRCGLDPVPPAARELEQAIGSSHLVPLGYEWEGKWDPETKKLRRKPGWTSTVRFGLPDAAR
jgi:hypothetical protein